LDWQKKRIKQHSDWHLNEHSYSVSQNMLHPNISTQFSMWALQKQTNFIVLSWLPLGASRDQDGTCEQNSKSTSSATRQKQPK
jgi:hypothetical protein